MTDQTPAEARFHLLWTLALGLRVPLSAAMPVVWQREVEKLIEQNRAQVDDDGKLVALPHSLEDRYTDEANTTIKKAVKIILLDLEADSPQDGTWWTQRCDEFGIDPEHMKLAISLLRGAKLIQVSGKKLRATFPPHRQDPPLTLNKLGILPVQRSAPQPSASPPVLDAPPPPAPAAPKPSASPQVTAPEHDAPSPAEDALDDFDSAPPAAPSAPPETPPTSDNAPSAPPPSAPPHQESSAPVRQESAPAAPEPVRQENAPAPARREPSAPAAPEPSAPSPEYTALDSEYLRRIATAVEAQAQATTNPHYRYRAPLGASPLLDTMRRIAVCLVVESKPTTASILTLNYLTRAQRTFLESALEEGVRLGVFTRTGGKNPQRRGAKYVLADPTPLGCTWPEINAAAAAILAERERRVVAR